MINKRRTFLKQLTGLATYTYAVLTGLLPKISLANWLEGAFANTTLEQTLKQVFNNASLTNSDKISLKLPLIAENGAVVPISVTSSLTNVEQIFILVEKNPVPLAAVFNLAPQLEPFVSARIKMAETCNVIVVVKAASQYYKTQQLVKVTIGGCGG